jgi:AcrR family transcriptional regulator
VTRKSVKSSTPSRPRGRPPDRDLPQRRRAQILEQAGLIFARRGYGDTDVQTIAAELGIAKGTIYRYCPSKQELFLAAVEQAVHQLNAHLGEAAQMHADPVAQLAASIRAYVEYFEKHPQLTELFVQERAAFGPGHRPVYFRVLDEHASLREAFISHLIATGRLRDVPPQRILGVIGNAMYGTVFARPFRDHRPTSEQVEDLVDVLLHGILRQPGSRQPAAAEQYP